MNCCPPTKFSFFNVPVTVVDYSQTLRTKYGDYPKVEVLYFDPSINQYVGAGIMTSVKLKGNPINQIVVDHGDPNARGFIKVS